MRKLRTRSHVIADLGVNHFERAALQSGYSVERYEHDYGLDPILFTYLENGEVQNGQVFVQVKATENLPSVRSDGTFPFDLSVRDVDYWLNEPMPVILVV